MIFNNFNKIVKRPSKEPDAFQPHRNLFLVFGKSCVLSIVVIAAVNRISVTLRILDILFAHAITTVL